MDKAAWQALVRGAGCPMDAPRAPSNDFCDLVAPLAVSSLYLAKNQIYRGQCVLIFDLRHAARPDHINVESILDDAAVGDARKRLDAGDREALIERLRESLR